MAATSNDSGSALQALQRCGARPQAEGQHHRYLQSRDVTLTFTMTHSPFSTTMMTLPRALPRSRYRKASAVSLSGYVSVDERSNPSGLDPLLESDQVVLVRCRDERAFLLAHEQ
jgi:hypothetical protein